MPVAHRLLELSRIIGGVLDHPAHGREAGRRLVAEWGYPQADYVEIFMRVLNTRLLLGSSGRRTAVQARPCRHIWLTSTMKQVLRDFVIPPGVFQLVYRIQDAREASRYSAKGDDYDAARYWQSHYRASGAERLFSSANQGLGDEANRRQYESARRLFESIVADFRLGPAPKVLEIGFGTGFYTEIVHRLEFGDYLGVDITDETIPGILCRLEGFKGELTQLDAGRDRIERPGCDLVYMIDVSQHIVNDDKLSFCLRENVIPNLKPGGFFIITDELSERSKHFYEKTRTLEFYREQTAGCDLYHDPIAFRDKYVFSFRKAGG